MVINIFIRSHNALDLSYIMWLTKFNGKTPSPQVFRQHVAKKTIEIYIKVGNIYNSYHFNMVGCFIGKNQIFIKLTEITQVYITSCL